MFLYAVCHLKIAGYEMLRRVARRARDEQTVVLVDGVVARERSFAERIAAAFEDSLETSLATHATAAD